MEKNIIQKIYPYVESRWPCWYMRQAGRVMPRYRQIRSEHGDFWDLFSDSERIFEISTEPLDRLDVDTCVIFSDILLPLEGLFEISLRYKSLSHGPELSGLQHQVHPCFRRHFQGFSEKFQAVLEAIHLVRLRYPHKELVGFCGAPWTLFCYLITETIPISWDRTLAIFENMPQALRQQWHSFLIQFCVQVLVAQAQAGATQLMIFDSWSAYLPKRERKYWIQSAINQISGELKKAHVHKPVIYYSRDLGDFCAANELSVEILACDRFAPIVQLERKYLIQGNLDLDWLYLSQEKLDQQIRKWVFSQRYPRIINLSEGLKPDIPFENLLFLTQRLKVYTTEFMEHYVSYLSD